MRHGPSADDLPLPVLGDRIAAQLEVLHDQTHRPVDVVAESEGTLGVYAMLGRHPGLPIGSVVLLSPIVEPGRVSYPSGPDAASVSEEALNELNHLVGEHLTVRPERRPAPAQLGQRVRRQVLRRRWPTSPASRCAGWRWSRSPTR